MTKVYQHPLFIVYVIFIVGTIPVYFDKDNEYSFLSRDRNDPLLCLKVKQDYLRRSCLERMEEHLIAHNNMDIRKEEFEELKRRVHENDWKWLPRGLAYLGTYLFFFLLLRWWVHKY